MIKRLCNRLYGINGIILIIYSLFIFSTYVFSSKFNLSIKYVIRWVFFTIIACVIICPLILKRLNRFVICQSKISYSISEKKKYFLLFFLIAFLTFLIYYIGYYPGGFYGDQIWQYRQAVTGEYDDWHPVIHTLLVFKMPLSLTFGWTGSIILFQIILFSLVIAYASYSLMIHSQRWVAVLFFVYVVVNPSTGNMAMQPTKDTTYAICTLLLITFAFRIVVSKGEWLRNNINLFSLILTVSLTTLIRHNGMLFTIPYIIAIFLYSTKKRTIISLISIVVIIIIIKFPLYSVIGVNEAKNRQLETLGLPMTVIGAVVTNNPESLDEEVLDFAYKVVPKKVWEDKYTYGDFNQIKWDAHININVIEEYGTANVIRLMIQSIKADPKTALLGAIKLTDSVYTVTDDYSYYETIGIADNEFGIKCTGVSFLQQINNVYTGSIMMIFPHLFMYIGSMMLLLIVSLLAKCKLNKATDWKRIIWAIPVLVYNFGTMFLLTGASDSSRFFYYSFLVVPIIMVILFTDLDYKTDERV